MKSIKEKITKPYDHSFRVSKPGLIAIFISARCKSKKQINSNVDEDLRIEINGLKFREIPPKKYIQLFNIPASWNGSKLKGLKKTIVFLTVLDKGEHIISLIPRDSAFIEDIEVKELAKEQNPTFNIEEQAEDGDRRPWYAFVLVDLPLKTIIAKVTLQYRWWDSDDVKVIIDNKVQKQPKAKLHIYWFFAGILIIRKLIQKTLKKRETKEHAFKSDLSQNGLRYIEFWADKTPILHKVELDLGEVNVYPEAKVVWQEVNLRKEPNSQSKSLAVLKKDEKVEILEKAVEGEAPYKDKGDYCNIWHKVKIDKKEGFVFSEGVEIKGEDKGNIRKKIKTTSQFLKALSALMLAIADEESNFFPYAVSEDNAKGIFQLTKNAKNQLEKEGFFIKDFFDIPQNIEGGIRYFQWLYNKVYKQSPSRLERSVTAYNFGPSRVPTRGDFERNLPEETKKFLKNVLKKYRSYKQNSGSSLIKLLIIGSILLISLSACYFLSQQILELKIFANSQIIKEYIPGDLEMKEYQIILEGNFEKEKIFVKLQQKKEVSSEFVSYKVNVYLILKKQEKFLFSLYGPLTWAKFVDLNKDGKEELLLQTAEGKLLHTLFYRYEENNLIEIPIIPSDNLPGFFGRNGIILINFPESTEVFLPLGGPVYDIKKCDGRAEIYIYYEKKLIRSWELKDATEWCREFKG